MTENIEQVLAEKGVYVSTTVGPSMRPMLRTRRDRVVILPKTEERLKRYDLPLYRASDGRYLLHRVIKVADGHYVIRGDNTYRKEYIPEERIIGYVSEFYRKGKHVKSDSRAYRAYAALWNFIYPIRAAIRWCMMLAWHCVRPIVRKIKPRETGV